jgi:hypothetical protein
VILFVLTNNKKLDIQHVDVDVQINLILIVTLIINILIINPVLVNAFKDIVGITINVLVYDIKILF